MKKTVFMLAILTVCSIMFTVTSQAAITMISTGVSHTVGLEDDGTVVAMGSNTYGQCDVSAWTDIVQVAAGDSHTVGLVSDGTVVAVGNWRSYYDYSYWADITEALDAGTDWADIKLMYPDVSDWTGIIQVAAGELHTVGLKSDGTVVATGYNYYGQCEVSAWTGITQVSAGLYHTVGVESGGTVVAIGRNSAGQCEVSSWTNITQVAASEIHTVGLRSDGTVVAAGYSYAYHEDSHGTDTVTITVQDPGTVNILPIADAGANQSVAQGDPVTLDGSGSSDPDGSIASYHWVRTSGTGVALSSTSAINPTFTAPSVAGTLAFQLTVEDDNGAIGTDTVTITVQDPDSDNILPIADAGANQSVAQGAPVTLDGSGSFDPDGSIARYRWVQTAGTAVTLSDTSATSPTFTAPSVAETLAFQLTVEDDGDDVSAWTGITQVAAGAGHTVGLRTDGTVIAVGNNDYGQCDVSDWTGIVQVAARSDHTVALESDGTIVALPAYILTDPDDGVYVYSDDGPNNYSCFIRTLLP